MTGQAAKHYPDGLSAANERATSVLDKYLGWVALFVLGALLLVAMLGVFGGGANETFTAQGPAARLSINAPRILRSGEFFETRIEIEAKSAIAKPVLAVPISYWREITINTMEPPPPGASSDGRYLLYEFDALDPGEVIELKVDGQINPSLFAGTEGTVALRDDEKVLVQIPLELRVFP